MVLYGYDASVYNAVLASDNWFEWVGLDRDTDTQMIGLSMFNSFAAVETHVKTVVY